MTTQRISARKNAPPPPVRGAPKTPPPRIDPARLKRLAEKSKAQTTEGATERGGVASPQTAASQAKTETAAPAKLPLPATTNLCWIDLETTGLDPVRGAVLEVSVVITDAELKELCRFSEVVWSFPNDLAGMSADVREMHEKSGLLEAVKKARKLEDVRRAMAFFIAKNGGHGAPLAGNTCTFERKWLSHYFPEVTSLLHYRNVDVSSFKEVAKRMGWLTEADIAAEKKKSEHRALPDVLHAIEELKSYEKMGFIVRRAVAPTTHEAAESKVDSPPELGEESSQEAIPAELTQAGADVPIMPSAEEKAPLSIEDEKTPAP